MSEQQAVLHRPVDGVFSVTELLEKILVDVDMKTVLLSQRVDKFWYNVINKSTKLQKKLFFLPASVDEAMSVTEPYKIIVRDGLRGREFLVQLEEEYTSREGVPPQMLVLNPLLFTKTIRRSSTLFQQERRLLRICDLRKLIDRPDSAIGSWRKMHFAHAFSHRMIFAAHVDGEQLTFKDVGVCVREDDTTSDEFALDYRDQQCDGVLTIGETLDLAVMNLTSKGGHTVHPISSYFVTLTRSTAVEEDEAAAAEGTQQASTASSA